jgi:hypothetical protein
MKLNASEKKILKSVESGEWRPVKGGAGERRESFTSPFEISRTLAHACV